MTPSDEVLRRLVPDRVQLQVLIGSLLGGGRVTGAPGARRLHITSARPDHIRWKYERLGAFAAAPPRIGPRVSTLDTIAHPSIDDLAALRRQALIDRADPLGLAVWLADVGRLELRADAFLPDQRTALCAAA